MKKLNSICEKLLNTTDVAQLTQIEIIKSSLGSKTTPFIGDVEPNKQLKGYFDVTLRSGLFNDIYNDIDGKKLNIANVFIPSVNSRNVYDHIFWHIENINIHIEELSHRRVIFKAIIKNCNINSKNDITIFDSFVADTKIEAPKNTVVFSQSGLGFTEVIAYKIYFKYIRKNISLRNKFNVKHLEFLDCSFLDIKSVTERLGTIKQMTNQTFLKFFERFFGFSVDDRNLEEITYKSGRFLLQITRVGRLWKIKLSN